MTLELNLLRTFLHVYETGSLTLTARMLFVTQPSVSHTLTRLRRELGDDLFTRSGRRMQPTPLAVHLYPVFKESVERIDRAAESVRSFDPSSSAHRFRLCLSDLGEVGYLPRILRRIGEEAPLVDLEVVPMKIELLAGWLAKGSVDAAIASWPIADGFESTVLKEEKYVCVVPREYPLDDGTMSLEQFTAARHAKVDPATGHQLVETTMDALGIVCRPAVVVQHFAVLPHVVSECEVVAVAPESMARRWQRTWPLRIVDLPFAVPALEVRLYRRAQDERSPALSWFHTTVLAAVTDH